MVKAKATARKTPTSPVEEVILKVRRFVLADIPKIIKLAKEAYDESSLKVAPFSEERLKRILNNNKNNDLLHADVLIDLDEVVGLFMGQMMMDSYTDENSGHGAIFFIKEEYRDENNVGVMMNSYKNWARRRGMREAFVTNYFMPEFNLNGKVGEMYKVEL